jgi:hypothetical protein
VFQLNGLSIFNILDNLVDVNGVVHKVHVKLKFVAPHTFEFAHALHQFYHFPFFISQIFISKRATFIISPNASKTVTF